MKRLPKGYADSIRRQKAQIRAFMPVSMLVFISAFFCSNDIFIYVVLICGATVLFVIVFTAVWQRYRGELRGKALKEFNELYSELVAHAHVEDLVRVVWVIEKMSRLLESDFYETLTYLNYNFFIFGSSAKVIESVEAPALTYLLIHAETMKRVWEVLHMDVEYLSVFLACPYAHFRQAAMARMEQLQERGWE